MRRKRWVTYPNFSHNFSKSSHFSAPSGPKNGSLNDQSHPPPDQGCIRPRPSPFQRPSTRFHGVSTTLRGGSIAGFWAEVGFDCRVFGFLGAKRPKRRQRRRFRRFWRFFENFTILMYIKSTKITFQGRFVRTNFCALTLKKSQIFARTFKINISASGRSTLCQKGPQLDQ